MTRLTHALAIPVLALTLALGHAPRAAFGQSPPANSNAFDGTNPEESKSEGRPLDGYLATLALVGLAVFIIGKSARR